MSIRTLQKCTSAATCSHYTHHVPDALAGVVLDSETARVTGGISAAALSSDGRKASEDRRALSDFAEHFRLAVLGHIVRDLEVTMCAR